MLSIKNNKRTGCKSLLFWIYLENSSCTKTIAHSNRNFDFSSSLYIDNYK